MLSVTLSVDDTTASFPTSAGFFASELSAVPFVSASVATGRPATAIVVERLTPSTTAEKFSVFPIKSYVLLLLSLPVKSMHPLASAVFVYVLLVPTSVIV